MSTPTESVTEPTHDLLPGYLVKPLDHRWTVANHLLCATFPIGTRVLVSHDCEFRMVLGHYVGGRDRRGRLRWYAVFVVGLNEQPFFIREGALHEWVALDP